MIKTWMRKRTAGRLVLFTRRDNAGVSAIGVTFKAAPDSGRRYPLAVVRVDRFDDDVWFWTVIGGGTVGVASRGLAWNLPKHIRLGPVVVYAGRRDGR